MRTDTITPATILDCGHAPTPRESDSCGTGYGELKDGWTFCYACAAELDVAEMREKGKWVGYLVWVGNDPANHPWSNWEVTNWPETLRFVVTHSRRGKHNMAGTRHDVWFTGPDGAQWHGTNYGENNQLCRCKRVKA